MASPSGLSLSPHASLAQEKEAPIVSLLALTNTFGGREGGSGFGSGRVLGSGFLLGLGRYMV